MKFAVHTACILLAGGLIAFSAGCAKQPLHTGMEDALAAASQYDLTPQQIQAAVGEVKPALVRIKVVEPSYRGGRENKTISYGSGTIIDPEGHVVTNHHVAGKAVQLIVTLESKEEVSARLIGTDAATDIAVIKLEPEEPTTFPYARFGDSDRMQVGDPVMALGSPLSISQSVTLGIISNMEMITPPMMRSWGMDLELDGENVGELVKWIGHDAAIYGGNSGGPLINLNGEIIGVNEIGMGLGGAIPGNLAKSVAEEIIEREYVRRSWFGFALQPLLRSSPVDHGVLISSIVADSPADAAGLKSGDVLLAVNGESVTGRFHEELPGINNLLVHLPAGEEADLTIFRGNEEMSVAVVPEEREPALLPSRELRPWGITARNLSRRARQDMAIDAAHGVIVTSTRSGGPANTARPELRDRDIILSVNGEDIQSVEHLEGITEAIVGDSEAFFPVLVVKERDGEQTMTVVEIGIDRLPTPARDVERAWLPIETQVLTRDLAEQLGIDDAMGVRVTRVYRQAPEGFPLEVGDILTHFDEMEIDAARPEDADLFDTMIRQYRVGMDVPVKLLRDGEEHFVEVILGGSPRQVREMPRWRDLTFEFVVREATFDDRTRPTMQDAEFYVLVDGLTSGGWADLGGLRVRDAILEIDGERIEGLDDVERLMTLAEEERRDQVVFFVRRGTRTHYLEMQPNWQ